MSTTAANVVKRDNVSAILDRALDAGDGLLRLTPTWVPRSFLHPGKRIRLHPDDWYAYGGHRGGIDERWFASTTDAANEGRVWHEGQSFCAFEGAQFLLKDAVAESGKRLIGESMWSKYGRWPVYSKFFDNMGPIPHHMHQSFEDAALVGQEGKPESYYFPPQYNNCDNHFPYTFMGLGNKEDNQILTLSKAYKLKKGSGWLIPPGVLHAPGSLCTYEPQWGSDVFSMFQNIVEGRFVPWSLLVKDMPSAKHQDLDFIIGQLDWERNVDPNFKANNYLEPIVADRGPGWVDRWVVYGRVHGQQLFSAKELTLEPGASCTIKDPGASGWLTVQGAGMVGKHRTQTPVLIRFGQFTDDEFFITHDAATAGVTVTNTGTEPMVGLRYFGPDVFGQMPNVGDR